MGFRSRCIRILGVLVIFGLTSLPAFGQEHADVQKILGVWDVEVDAGGEYFYLTLLFEEAEEKLRGTISEATGYFSDVPLESIVYDGETLSFEFTAPTPPDGLDRVISSELTVSEDKLQGSLIVSELGMSAICTATKKK